MWRWAGSRAARLPEAERPTRPGARRDRLALLAALVAFVCVGSAFVLRKDTQFLMPGPLTSAHSAIENCSACHSKSGSGKLSWIRGLMPGEPHADSKACLTCHKMPDPAFNAHGAATAVLQQSTKRLAQVAARTPQPRSARAQSIAVPTHDMVGRGLNCATCHQEHQGVGFDLAKISNEQCRSCHEVKFDSFDGAHPAFDNYPFRRRTRIIYDHAGHFGKHFPEVAKKNPARRIPDTCSACHNSNEDKRVMAVAPFERTCTACHLDQVVGKERVSGPKGIAFLSLPGLDVQTLRQKKAAIGEWPDASEAELTPFMKVMISRNAEGRALIKSLDGVDLQDLGNATDDQIKAVKRLVWEIKGLFYALIKGKVSDVLGDLNIGGGAKLSATLVADLTASIPRDVVIGAHQQWLPNLGAEMAKRPDTSDQEQGGWTPVITGTGSASDRVQPASDKATGPKKAQERVGAASAKADGGTQARAAKPLPPPMRAGIKGAEDAAATGAADSASTRLAADESSGAIKGRWQLPSGTSRAIEARSKGTKKGEQPEVGRSDDEAADSKQAPSEAQPHAAKGAGTDAKSAAQPKAADGASNSESNKPVGEKEPRGDPADQSDDLLFPTPQELRAMKSGGGDAATAAQPAAAAAKSDAANAAADGASSDAIAKADANAPASDPVSSESAAAEPRTAAAPVISIESDVDPESWAEYGGWYRQDYAIFYRPTGHKDKFIYSWLTLSGPRAPRGDKSPAAAVFDYLSGKDAQGSCTKCHSVDDIQGGGRVVNFSPPSAKSKQGRFTRFVHEPHFGIMEDRGCLTCHALEKGRPYLKSYEQGNPLTSVSNFGAVKKELCQSCHTSGLARQDCLLCHNYHVNGVITPIISTKIPHQ